MQESNIILTETDRVILSSYKSVIEGLSDYLGDGYEIVLHSLENYDKSIIHIVNGYYTGRSVGGPITNLALDMLEKIKKNKINHYYSYNTINKNGEPMHSTTIAVQGENNRIIGLICINFYLKTSLASIIANLIPSQQSENVKTATVESFHDSADEVVFSVTQEVRQLIMEDDEIPAGKKKRAMIVELNNRGIFNIKDSVAKVASILGVTRNTVYTYIREQ